MRTRPLPVVLLGAVMLAALFFCWKTLWPQGVTGRAQELTGADTTFDPLRAAEAGAATNPTALASQPARIDAPAGWSCTIRGWVLAKGRLPADGLEIVAYQGQATDRRLDFGELMSLAQDERRDARNREDAIVLQRIGPPLARTRSAADGTFRLEGVRTRHVRLTIDHTHWTLPTPVPVHVPEAAPEHDAGALRATLGAHVLGQVVPAPAAGTEVQLAAEMDPFAFMQGDSDLLGMILSRNSTKATTDAGGRFEFRGAPLGPQVQALCRTAEALAGTSPFSLAAGETREVVLRAVAPASVAVTVEDERGGGLAEAAVRLTALDAGGDVARAMFSRREKTDAAGRCVLTPLAAGRVEVSASVPGRTQAEQTLTLSPGTQQSVTLRLGSGGSVSGTVVDDRGAKVAGAGIAVIEVMKVPVLGDLTAIAGDDLLGNVARDSKCRTDSEGRFTLTGIAAESEFGLACAHPDYVATVHRPVLIGATDVRIVLQQAGRIRARVVGADDRKPIPNFRVQTLVTMVLVVSRPTRSEEFTAGEFTLGRVPPGNATLRLTAAGFGAFEQKVAVEAGQELDLGEIALARAATITGRVVDTGGTPVANATITRRRGGLADHPALAALSGGETWFSDRAGRFVIQEIAPGKVTLSASAQGFAPGLSARLELAPGQQLTDVEIRLGHGGAIAGRILLPPGRSVAGFEVLANRPGGAPGGGSTPAFDGSFRIENLEPGRYEVQAFDTKALEEVQQRSRAAFKPGRKIDFAGVMSAMTENLITTTCTVKDGQTTDVVLDGTGLEAKGTQLVAEILVGEQPLAEGTAELTLTNEQGIERRAAAWVQDGKLTHHGLAPGRLLVQIRSGMMMAPIGEAQSLTIPAGMRVFRTTLRLPGGGLRGRVIEERSGAPLESALVRLLPAKARANEQQDQGFAITDKSGHFEFKGLAAGTWSLVADEQLRAQGSAQSAGRIDGITLVDGQTLDGLVLRARAGGTLTATIVDASQRRVAQAWCLAVDRDGRPFGTLNLQVSDRDGRVTFAGLPQGEARIVARIGGLAPGASLLEAIVPGREITTTVVLTAGTHTSLRIEDAQGKPLPTAKVTARVGDGPWIPALLLQQGVEPDGSLDFGPLPAGQIHLRIEHPALGRLEATRTIPDAPRARLSVGAAR